jgi:uncharacterized protein (DUF1800 family)
MPVKDHRDHRSNRAPKVLAVAAQAAVAGIAVVLLVAFSLSAENEKKKPIGPDAALAGVPVTELTAPQAIQHALDRLGYGPKPGEIESVQKMGLAKWIDQQLHPESINDSAMEARLEKYPTLDMSSAKLLEQFPRPQLEAKREGITVEEYRRQQLQMAGGGMQTDTDTPPQAGPAGGNSGSPAAGGNASGDSNSANGTMNGTADGSPNAAPSMQPAPMQQDDPITMQLKALAKDKGQSGPGNNMFNYEKIHLPQRVVAELAMAKTERAIYSDRQLYEQMVDFWFNHFNVYAQKGQDVWLLTAYERDAIRPHAMGKFRDLLEATAKSPAMLFYLDNWLSVDPDAWKQLQAQRQMRQQRYGFGFPGARGQQGNAQQQKQNQDRGLNENYGRELMELHTLGVDGGYTQQDVIEVARCFTGWSIRTPQRDPQFYFEDRLHDNKPKMVLGHKIDEGGMRDGEAVLDLLARDPHTAHHLSLEIAKRFVSDNPPESLVDKMSQTYLQTDGDIRAVLHTMIYSPEFWSKDAYHSMVKTPFELVVSAARAVGADVDLPLQIVQWSARIGQPLYQCQPPTGYSDKADAWVNTGALLNRLNYSLALTANRMRGVRTDVASLIGDTSADDPHAVLDRTIQVLLDGQVTVQTHDTLEKQLDNPQVLQASLDDPVQQVNVNLIAGLVLGAPEFQRR